MRAATAKPPSRRYDLKAAPENICVGYFDNRRAPALRAASGDTIYVETLNHFGDGVSQATATVDLIEFRKQAKQYGPHTVTGPVYIEGAEPGDARSRDLH